MRKIIFATSNEGKIFEAKSILSHLGIDIQPMKFDFNEPTSGTMQEVALNKLKQVIDQGYTEVFVEDSGIFFAAYDQFPGILSKRVFQGIGYQGIAKLLFDESNKAWFEGVIAIYYHGQIQTFSACMQGQIDIQMNHDYVSEPGLPFDPIFIPDGEKQVLFRLPVEKRLHYSYRRQALLQMVQWINRDME